MLGSACEKRVHFRAHGHGRRGAGARDGNSGYGASESRRGDNVFSFGEGYGESSVEGVAGTGGFHNKSCVDGRDMGFGARIFHERALRAESDYGIARAFR